VVNFQTATKRNVLLTPGLGFVATTRTEYYEKLAFENLPPYEDFLAIRNTATFKDREKSRKRLSRDITNSAKPEQAGIQEMSCDVILKPQKGEAAVL